jgi:hypothetical protein
MRILVVVSEEDIVVQEREAFDLVVQHVADVLELIEVGGYGGGTAYLDPFR